MPSGVAMNVRRVGGVWSPHLIATPAAVAGARRGPSNVDPPGAAPAPTWVGQLRARGRISRDISGQRCGVDLPKCGGWRGTAHPVNVGGHQAVLECVRQDDVDWRRVFEAVDGSRDSAGVEWAQRSADYEPTGLSVAMAMLDLAKRRQRAGLPGLLPLPVRWGHREIITGDAIRGIPAEGRLLPQGAVLEGGEWLPTGGYFWPDAAGEALDLTYRSPQRILQLGNVYTHVAGNGQAAKSPPTLAHREESGSLGRPNHFTPARGPKRPRRTGRGCTWSSGRSASSHTAGRWRSRPCGPRR